MSIIQELKFIEILARGSDKEAPVAKQYQINARFIAIDPNSLIITFQTQDFGPQGSRRIHTTQFQLNERFDKQKWDRRLNLPRIKNNKPAITAYIVNGFIMNGHANYWCSCESFLYGGFAYISTRDKSEIEGHEENRPPNKTNPFLKGSACKHVLGLLQNIHIFKNQIVDGLIKSLKQPVKSRNKKYYKTVLHHPDWTTLDVDLDNWDYDDWYSRLQE